MLDKRKCPNSPVTSSQDMLSVTPMWLSISALCGTDCMQHRLLTCLCIRSQKLVNAMPGCGWCVLYRPYALYLGEHAHDKYTLTLSRYYWCISHLQKSRNISTGSARESNTANNKYAIP